MSRRDNLDWPVLGPRCLAWLRERVPQRKQLAGLVFDCSVAHGIQPVYRLNCYLNRTATVEWNAIKASLGTGVPATERVSEPAAPEQEVSVKDEPGKGLEARANGRKIKTVADLLAYIEADMSKYEVAGSEATKYEGVTKNEVGEAVVTEMFRVFVRLKPKAGPTTVEIVEAMIAGAFVGTALPKVRAVKPSGDDLQVVNIFDPHVGKYAWRGSTGGPDYDLAIARRCIADAAAELLGHGDRIYKPGRRIIVVGGDYFHADTVGGTTTAGTFVERDGRYQKMIAVGCDVLISVIDLSAATCPTEVFVVPGNHDEILSAALQRILIERFRNDARVTVDEGYLPRKYRRYGGNLLGFTHGDKAKKKLPQLMALEAASEWGSATYREIHTGHFHSQTAEWQRPIETIDGVVVRIAPSIGPADDWHVGEGFIGAVRGMESFFYRKAGGLIGMHMSSPDFAAA